MSAVRTGTSLGRYRLEELLSRGGMGEVWRGYDTTLGRPVAVKVLHAGVSDPDDRERFLREARAAAQLSHRHVVAVFDVGEWSGRPFLVMELLDGLVLSPPNSPSAARCRSTRYATSVPRQRPPCGPPTGPASSTGTSSRAT